MGQISSGVYPAWENMLTIDLNGGTGEPNYAIIAEIESFGISIDGNTEEWAPYELEGWLRRMNTGKSFTLSCSGKRHIGDPGNDYIASKAFETGQDTTGKIKWVFPSSAMLEFYGVINVTAMDAAESRNVAPLEFEIASDGKPVFTDAA
jgi:hypothetical protein